MTAGSSPASSAWRWDGSSSWRSIAVALTRPRLWTTIRDHLIRDGWVVDL